VIRQTAARMKPDTLIIFAADHSFDLRVRGGRKNEPLLPPGTGDGSGPAGAKPNVRVDDGHTGEEVLVAGQGPGSGRIRGYFANTDLFRIMLSAYGWETSKSAR
jgi:alkaline phosphatase